MPTLFNVMHASEVPMPIADKRDRATLFTTAWDLNLGGTLPRRVPAGVKFLPWGCQGIILGDSEMCGAYKLGLDAAGNYFANELEDVLSDTPGCEYQKAFRLADGVEGTAIDVDHFRARDWVTQRLDLMSSEAVAHELIAGWAKEAVADPGNDVDGGIYDGTGNHAFSLDATVLTPPANTLKVALIELEEWLATQLHGGVGMIHCSPGILSNVVGDTGAKLEDGIWTTATGHRIVADAGYANMVQPTGQAAPADDERWIYGSGPVFYWIDGVKFVGEANQESMDMEHDDVFAVGDRRAIVIYDPCAVGAVKVDVTA